MALFSLSDIGTSGDFAPDVPISANATHDIFKEKKRKAWHGADASQARCDLSIRRLVMAPHGGVPVVSIWKKTLKGRLLTDIKADPNEIEHFAREMSPVIVSVLGKHLDKGGWAICASPRRRHKEHNFACAVAALIAEQLHIPYYDDVVIATKRERINANFELGKLPTENNIIVFDDFVTTGSTVKQMKELLEPLGKNCVFFVGIDNNHAINNT